MSEAEEHEQGNDNSEEIDGPEELGENGVAAAVEDILRFMKTRRINLPTFLHAVVGVDNQPCRTSMLCAKARGLLYKGP
ncbi:hypothetical protein FRB94_001184 [Tulasnella sp. JGI-2019a]|nr:hypothetical protein FRB93_012555 [Tulasnella sp. JGI-2019a]KAG8987992.1 hypothetical protein FRB94_001184 [Tulasnella sp. JGI-2019a]